MNHRKTNREYTYTHIYICIQKVAAVIMQIKEIEAMHLERDCREEKERENNIIIF